MAGSSGQKRSRSPPAEDSSGDDSEAPEDVRPPSRRMAATPASAPPGHRERDYMRAGDNKIALLLAILAILASGDDDKLEAALQRIEDMAFEGSEDVANLLATLRNDLASITEAVNSPGPSTSRLRAIKRNVEEELALLRELKQRVREVLEAEIARGRSILAAIKDFV